MKLLVKRSVLQVSHSAAVTVVSLCRLMSARAVWHAHRSTAVCVTVRSVAVRLSPSATLPCRGSSGAAGYDLSAAASVTVPSRGRLLVPTDLSLAVPLGTYGRIAPRSGLALKSGIDVGAGVVDSDYRGSLGVLLFNHSDTDFSIAAGDRIAQLILERIAVAEVEETNELAHTERGHGGFGSTGVAANKRIRPEAADDHSVKE